MMKSERQIKSRIRRGKGTKVQNSHKENTRTKAEEIRLVGHLIEMQP